MKAWFNRLPAWLRQPVGAVVAGLLLLGLIGFGGKAAFAALGIGTSAQNPSTSVAINLQKGLVGHWDFNGDAKDNTPYASNGVISGAAAANDRKAKSGSAYSFNGTSDRIQIPINNGLQPTTGLTVSMWVKPGDMAKTTNQKFLSNTQVGGYNLTTLGSTADVCPAERLMFAVHIDGNYRTACVNRNILTNNTWYHLAGTYDGSNVTLYVDGVAVASTAFAGTMTYSGNNPLCIGSEPNVSSCTAGDYYTGVADDVRVYNRGMPAAEVKALYSQYDVATKLSAGQNGLLAWFKLDGNTKDTGPYHVDATNSGATLTTGPTGRANAAYSFNGTSNYISSPLGTRPSAVDKTTLSFWAKKTGAGVTEPRAIIAANSLMYIDQCYAGQVMVSVYTTAGQQLVYGGTCAATGTWRHYAATYDRTATKLYIDGVLVATAPQTAAFISPLGTTFIGRHTGASHHFNGSVSDVRVYNRALSDTEIAGIYNPAGRVTPSGNNLKTNVYSQDIRLSQGLVGYWPFNGNANDVTPYGHNGTVSGAVLTADRRGRTNSAYSFTGSGGFIDTNHKFPLDKMTISIWINSTDNAGGARSPISNARDCCGTYNGFSMLSGGYAPPRFTLWHGTSTIVDGGSIPLNTWTHLVATYDGTSLKYYQDGILIDTDTSYAGPIGTPTANVYIGRLGATTAGYFKGSLDDPRIYNRALSASEVSALYNEYR